MSIRKIVTNSLLEAWESGEFYRWIGYDCVFDHLVVCVKGDEVLVIASEYLWKIIEDYYKKSYK